MTRVGGVDSFLYTPNGKLHRYVTKLAFKNLGHPFQPFVHGQKVIGPKLAKKFGIKLIMYGENQAEYGNPLEENKDPFMKSDFFTIDNPLDMILGGEKVEYIINDTEFTLNDFSPYIPPTEEEIKNSILSTHNMTWGECFDKMLDNPKHCPSSKRMSIFNRVRKMVGDFELKEFNDDLIFRKAYEMYPVLKQWKGKKLRDLSYAERQLASAKNNTASTTVKRAERAKVFNNVISAIKGKTAINK